jgi:HK97 family phage prohead protease
MTRYTRLFDSAPQVAADDRVIKFTFATDQVALDGHRILAGAWQSRGWDGLKEFKENPVFAWAHDMSQPPVGKVVNISENGGKLTGAVRFADTPFADEIYQLFRGSFLRGASVGWLPIDWSYAKGANREKGAIDFKKVRLLEISAVTVPSDSGALSEARSAGLRLDAVATWARSASIRAETAAQRDQAKSLAGLLGTRAQAKCGDGGAFGDLFEEAKTESARLLAQLLVCEVGGRLGPSRADLIIAARASLREFEKRARLRGLSSNRVAQLAAIFRETMRGRLDG